MQREESEVGRGANWWHSTAETLKNVGGDQLLSGTSESLCEAGFLLADTGASPERKPKSAVANVLNESYVHSPTF